MFKILHHHIEKGKNDKGRLQSTRAIYSRCYQGAQWRCNYMEKHIGTYFISSLKGKYIQQLRLQSILEVSASSSSMQVGVCLLQRELLHQHKWEFAQLATTGVASQGRRDPTTHGSRIFSFPRDLHQSNNLTKDQVK